MVIHNHGSEEGEGLACNELRLPDGSLKGKCLMTEKESEMPEKECAPTECQEQAKKIVADYIKSRYEKEMEFDVFVTQFTYVGMTWKASLSTTLPESAHFVVEYYALKDTTTLKVYALTTTAAITRAL